MKTSIMFIKHFSLIISLFLLCTCLSCNEENGNTFDGRYVHEVYFWFQAPNNAEARALFETSLKKFLSNSKYAKTNFLGTPPKATREVVDDSFTYNLTLTFESAAAQDAYQKEAAHLLFIKECEHLWKKVIVYDAIAIE